MPVSSTPSKRVALASLNVNVASPLHKHNKVFASDSLPLTPSLTPKILLPKSASVLVPSVTSLGPSRAVESFSDYKITNSRNVKADLAATKLKLRLQLAFYKLKLKRDKMVASCPTIKVSKAKLPKPRTTFHGSANVNLNLQTLGKTLLLTSVAAQKTSVNSAHLRLYHIKPLSSYHNVFPNRLPLSSASNRLPPVHKILKTPIKAANRTLMYNSINNTNVGDDTIDENADDTHIETKRKDDFLGSSPLRTNSFGTPNRFSVAKSLLQLGLGYY